MWLDVVNVVKMHHSFLLLYSSIQLPRFIVSNVISINDNYLKNTEPRASTKATKTADLIRCLIDNQWIKCRDCN